tara:strand:- start:217 stop:450 length:234 start_codon:yes stop_codon:yes gene_type:complete
MEEGEDNWSEFDEIVEMRHGWIQQELQEIFQIITELEIFEGDSHQSDGFELIDIGIKEVTEFLKELKSYRTYLKKYS